MTPFLGISGEILREMVLPLLDQSYHLYLDNLYTSIPLFNDSSPEVLRHAVLFAKTKEASLGHCLGQKT